jgi:hypothetical protein
MAWNAAQLYGYLLKLLDREFPKVKVVDRKFVWWAKVMDALGCPSGVTTTIYHTMAVPSNWAQTPYHIRASVLWHEIQHLRQARRSGGDWVGWFLTWGPAYLLVPLPMFWTLRAKWEREAYAEAMRVHFLLGMEGPRSLWQGWMVKTFTTKTYLWMWPNKRRVRRWAKEVWANMLRLKAIGKLDEPFKF